ncbi:MAG TPA: RraA family protein [Lacipirellulaceae bacterium]|nr:RraA family protein [Lacipirellulaceae bacterium]
MRAPRDATFVIATIVLLSIGLAGRASAQSTADAESARSGRSLIETQIYSLEDDRKLLELFDGLRVADISDGMDQAGLADVGLVSPRIGPLWKDTQHFTHRVIGIAVTVRYVPANDPRPAASEAQEFDRWVGETYSNVTPEPFVPLLREGSVLCIEEAAETDVGSIGSNNIMGWKERGCRGVITSSTARDTDEIIAQKIPLYFRQVGRGIRPGRNEVESVNRPIAIGGVQVQPGDVVAADGDGVIVVPRKYAEQVARYARATLETDKAARRGLYQRLGLPEDDSVR